ncbi:MAG: sulfatase [Lachnospiraceae bacterium]
MKKNNILVIVTDQLTWRALPAYGNTYARTPNIDRISEHAVIYDECYTPCPLCQPARTSFWSGIYPHETGVLSNGLNFPVEDLDASIPTLGSCFSEAGYETVHFGKRHDAGGLRGFWCEKEGQTEVPPVSDAWPVNMDTFADRYTTDHAVKWLSSYNEDKPFLMVADLVNPHNICGFIGAFQGENEGIDPGVPLPPLPENFDFPDIENRPLPVQYICCSHNRQAQVSQWTPRNFQYYLAAYYHYLQRADSEIGRILDTLYARPDAEDTLIVFMADHGDSMAARHRVTKQVDFYEEVTRVPFLFAGKGIVPRRISNRVTSLLDLFPTLCGYAGIPVPNGLRGMDLSSELLGGSILKREYVASEWHTEWGFTISPGRMIRDERYKYTRYVEGDGEELYDLAADPLETKNLAFSPEYQSVLERMRNLYRRHLELTNDPFESLQWKADIRWRSHPLGYQNHRGIAAPQEDEE